MHGAVHWGRLNGKVRTNTPLISMKLLKNRWFAAMGSLAAVSLLAYAIECLRFHYRWRMVMPPMSHLEVRALLGNPEDIGFKDIFGGERADKVWCYWHGFSVYTVDFDTDTNGKPTIVNDKWSRRRWDECWFPPHPR